MNQQAELEAMLLEEMVGNPLDPVVDPADLHNQLYEIVAELVRRNNEALRLYEPQPEQERFHRSPAPERVFRAANRVGKTLAACIEDARAVTGQDPYHKYPLTDGRLYLVARDQKEVGQVLARKLFRPGAFKIIRDPETKLWRAYRPWNAWDAEHLKDARPAPPLIPPRFIESFGWVKKKDYVPSTVRLRNGWEMVFFSSEGKPPHGVDIDMAHFDEEIIDPDWYPEIAARLIDRSGKFIWSATPQAGTAHLFELHERAHAEENHGAVEEFYMALDDNQHLLEKDKLLFAGKILSEDERRVRIHGEFALSGRRVYPEWDKRAHIIEPFTIPPDWSRYLAVDPGAQVCAVLFCAVPPPNTDWGDAIFFYDELYLKRCSAELFGERVATKASDCLFEAFVIDHQMSRVTEMGSGLNIELQYSEALRKRKVSSRRTRSEFMWGSTDVLGRVDLFRAWLHQRQDGIPKLRIFKDRLPNFEHEIKFYSYKTERNRPTSMPLRKNDHLMYCAQALASMNEGMGPLYVKPPVRARGSEVSSYLRKKRKRNQSKEGNYIRLGPEGAK